LPVFRVIILSATLTLMKTLASVVRPATFIEAPTLSALFGIGITFADETKQHTGSFKFRGAYNLAANVENDHILASSSGSFALALAYACSLLNKRFTAVMPSTAAEVKIEGVKKYGGQIEFGDTAKTSRAEKLAQLAKKFPDAYVTNAYDNALIIEGNATLGHEIMMYEKPFDYIIVPIGGGGLISGIINGIKPLAGANACKSNCPVVIGAEPSIANDAARSLRAGHIVANETEPLTIADGARTLSVGKLNWEIISRDLKHIIEVPEADIKKAVKLIYDHLHLKVEPTGALSLAALMVAANMFQDKSVCCILSGCNVDDKVFELLIQ
jgi:threo-3-hydroxy-L-aspartate ammonia-lyase